MPNRGFTLLELVITLVVATIMLLTAVSSFDQWQARQRMKSAVHAMQQDLLAARSQALTTGIKTVLCPGSIAQGCEDSSDWSQGWIGFQDINDNRNLDPTEPVIRSAARRDHLHIMSSIHRRHFRFFGNGSAPGSNGSIWFCGLRGPEYAQRVVVSNTGRIRRDDSASLEPEDCP